MNIVLYFVFELIVLAVPSTDSQSSPVPETMRSKTKYRTIFKPYP